MYVSHIFCPSISCWTSGLIPYFTYYELSFIKHLNAEQAKQNQKYLITKFQDILQDSYDKNNLSLAQNRQVGQWCRIETSEINSHVYKQIIFSKQARNNPWSKDCVFNEFCWGNSVYACRSTKQDTYLTHYTKTNLQ